MLQFSAITSLRFSFLFRGIIASLQHFDTENLRAIMDGSLFLIYDEILLFSSSLLRADAVDICILIFRIFILSFAFFAFFFPAKHTHHFLSASLKLLAIVLYFSCTASLASFHFINSFLLHLLITHYYIIARLRHIRACFNILRFLLRYWMFIFLIDTIYNIYLLL